MKYITDIGPVMLDVHGHALGAEEREKLNHPLVGGVILFARNYASIKQLQALTTEIHALRSPSLLIAVDHEGGRIQRFKDGFTLIPPMHKLGAIWDINANKARKLARQVGYVIATELKSCGIDFSLTPVLDVDYSNSSVIGDRAFHREPRIVADLACNLCRGMRRAGMAAVGKHFPGHGFVKADSHYNVPVDTRQWKDILKNDLFPFQRAIDENLEAVMPAHVVYPAVDKLPAGFSSKWLKQILRLKMGFNGAVFSDDLNMKSAAVVGGIVKRAGLALSAGCDMILVCNNPENANQVLDGLPHRVKPASRVRLGAMRVARYPKISTLVRSTVYTQSVNAVKDCWA
jgi:beta-N-acetylhexosaminidase